MNDRDDELRQTTALFRYGLIADLVHLPLGTPGTAAKLRDKAGQTYAIPGTARTRVAANTMRDWIRHYRDGGFEALYPIFVSAGGREHAEAMEWTPPPDGIDLCQCGFVVEPP